MQCLKRHASKLIPRRKGNIGMLFHGTSPAAARAIAKTGMLRPQCRRRAACFRGKCECQMLAFGAYFAELDKAKQFARRRAAWDEETKQPVCSGAECAHPGTFSSCWVVCVLGGSCAPLPGRPRVL